MYSNVGGEPQWLNSCRPKRTQLAAAERERTMMRDGGDRGEKKHPAICAFLCNHRKTACACVLEPLVPSLVVIE